MTFEDDIYLCCFQVVDKVTSRPVSTGDFTFSFSLSGLDWKLVREDLVVTIKHSFEEQNVWSEHYYAQILSICKLP